MKMKSYFAAMCLVLLPAVSFAQPDADAQYAKDLLQPGTIAPPIIAKQDGRKVDILQENRGKYIILEFWASWCGDCRGDMAMMRSINRTYCSDSIMIQGYSFDKEEKQWAKCVKDSVLAWDQELSPLPMRQSQVSQDYHLNWIPSYHIIDKEGRIMLSTVMVEKVVAKLEELAPNATPDDQPLSAVSTLRQQVMNDLSALLERNIKYPEMCQTDGVEGHAVVSFVTDRKGNVSDVVAESVEVTKVESATYRNATKVAQQKANEGYAKQFARAAVASIRTVDKAHWRQACNGRPKMKMRVPVRFRLKN